MNEPQALMVFVCLLALGTAVSGTPIAELYFSNKEDIMRLTNGSSTIVISDPTLVDAIDCNVCDKMIYWVDQPGIIKRANPANHSSVEVIVQSDLDGPKGLAVDWRGSNVYFSHGTGNRGRVEVASCDGRHRKVLVHDIDNVGPVAVNIATGYLYFTRDSYRIYRTELSGDNEELIYEDFDFNDFFGCIVGLEVDINNNVLYWTNEIISTSFAIKYLNLSDLHPDLDSRMAGIIPTNEHSPYQLTIYNNTLYWTEPNAVDLSAQEITKPGALYAMDIVTQAMTLLLQNDTLSPHDVCYFFDDTVPPTGCALSNGGCSTFCFTVPDGTGGTRPQCGCPTGIIMTAEGTCPRYPDQFLLFTQEHNSDQNNVISHTDVRIIALNHPVGSFIDVLTPITIQGTSAKFLAYDITLHKVYWSQMDPPRIMRSDLDEPTAEAIIQTSISFPEALVVDPYAMNLYWVDSNLDKIEVYGLESGHRKTLVYTGRKPQGLAIDLRNRYLYWTDLELDRPKVERCHLDGTGREEILENVDRTKFRSPTTITVDPLTDWVYLAEVQYDSIFWYNGVTGEPREEKISGLSDVAGLAVHGDYLYWTDRSGNGVSMGRVDKNSGTNKQNILSINGLHGLIAANQSAASVFPACMCDQLCLPSMTSTPTCACADHLTVNSEGRCIEPVPLVYLSTGISLVRYFFDPNKWIIDNTFESFDVNATAMDMYVNGSYLYWIDGDDNLIYRSLADSNSFSREKVIKCCVGQTADLAVDWFGQNLYWIDSIRRVIEVAKLNGEHRIMLYKIPETLGVPNLITLDPLRGHLYWAPASGAKIYRLSMDGTSSVDENTLFWESDEFLDVFGMAMNYTEEPGVRDQLYWGSNTVDASTVVADLLSKDVDSEDSGVEEAFGVLNEMTWSYGERLSAFNGTFYFLGRHKHGPSIGYLNHNIPGEPELALSRAGYFSYLPTVTDFYVGHHSLQPGQHECSVNNNECGGDAVCLVESGVSGECVCPPLQAHSNYIGGDGVSYTTCASTDIFLLLATEDSIYHLPVPPPGSTTTSTVQPLPLGLVGQIETLAYDPVNKSVLYTDNSGLLHSVALDSSSESFIPLPDDLRPFSLAYDWKGGHIFSTERNGFQIDMMTINGEGVGSVLDFDNEKLYALNVLGEVVFDTITSTLYWTYVSVRDNLGIELHYMSLHDMIEHKIDIGSRKIEKLTLDTVSRSLYWINRNTSNHIIEKYCISTGTNTTTIETRANSVVALATAKVSDNQSYLFWYDQSQGIIYQYDGTTKQEYRRWNPGNVTIIAMLGHMTEMPPSPCLANPRPCSHFCLEGTSQNSYQCDCPKPRQLTDGNTCTIGNCSSLLRSCGDVFGECYPRTYWCDNIQHCRNGADEICDCPIDSFGCYLSPNGSCVSMSDKCDGVPDCPNGEDEIDCCMGNTFGCYVEDDTPDQLGGGPILRYACLNNRSICDEVPDCHNNTIDEPDNCPTPATATSPPSPTTLTNLPIIITGVVLSSVVVVVAFVLCCCLARILAKKKQEYITSSTMTRALNFNLASYKPRDSPQFRVDSQSDYYSDSNGTITTQLNGSSVSQNSMYKRRSGLSTDPSNPPPSPMTLRHSPALTDIEDDGSVFSEHMSEYPIPPAPNPSLNYDIISDNLSYSVSQSQYPATISGRAPNPLLFQQHRQYGYPLHNGGYHPPTTPQRSQWANGGTHSQYGVDKRDQQHTNGKHPYSSTDSFHHYPPTHPRKELDSLARTETDSTISMTTMSTENRDEYQYEDMMSYPPPGRPPSPVTVVSDYPPLAPPMSPDSTLSELSEDECSERHLHQT